MGDNRSILANDPVNANTDIKKVYPQPRTAGQFSRRDRLSIHEPWRHSLLYRGWFFKYYEYEYTIDDVLPTIVYYVNVTAFDYGYPGMAVPGMEGNPWENARAVYPLPSSEVIAKQGRGCSSTPIRIASTELSRGKTTKPCSGGRSPRNKPG